MGVKGSLATTLPSKIELNMERRAVKAKPDRVGAFRGKYWTGLDQPIANIDFIFTMVRSLFVFFSFSSSCSIFLFLLLSRFAVSP